MTRFPYQGTGVPSQETNSPVGASSGSGAERADVVPQQFGGTYQD